MNSPSAPASDHPQPQSVTDLFVSFTLLALQGFGGVMAVVQHELVEKKRWMTREEFIEDWAVAQVMPGPNVVNLSMMIGARSFGFKGAMAALAGMLTAPLILVLLLALVYARFSDIPGVAGALRGMGAVAAGLIAAQTGRRSGQKRAGPAAVRRSGRAVLCGDCAAALAAGLCADRPGRRGLHAGLFQAQAMTGALTLVLTVQDWLNLLAHYLMLSLLSVGGAVSTVPDMHRFLVEQQHWLTDAQFNASIALAQASPGPNLLFVALLGWNVGLNAGGWPTGLLGVLLSLMGILVPSTALTYAAAQWGHRNRELRAVRAFKQGLAPIVVALLMATSWIMASANGSNLDNWPLWLVTAATAVIVWRSKIHLLWLLGAGALLGWHGLI